jgi:hypothetical protein
VLLLNVPTTSSLPPPHELTGSSSLAPPAACPESTCESPLLFDAATQWSLHHCTQSQHTRTHHAVGTIVRRFAAVLTEGQCTCAELVVQQLTAATRRLYVCQLTSQYIHTPPLVWSHCSDTVHVDSLGRVSTTSRMHGCGCRNAVWIVQISYYPGMQLPANQEAGIVLLPAACDRCWCWGCCCRCTCLLCLLGRTWQVWLLLQLLGPDLRPLQHLVRHSPSAHQHLHRQHTPYQPQERAPLAAARYL